MVRKTHSDHCKSICIGCLNKGKSFRTIVKAKGDNLLKFRVLSQLNLDADDLDYLPTVICTKCRIAITDLTISAPDYPVKVDYKGFIANVKKYLQQNDNCDCQICTLGSASLNADPSVFLLEVQKKEGRPVLPKQTKLTDFFRL